MFVVDSVHETVFIVVSPSNQQMPGRPGPPESERRPGSGSGMWLQRSKPGTIFLIALGSDLPVQVADTFSCWQNAPEQHLISKWLIQSIGQTARDLTALCLPVRSTGCYNLLSLWHEPLSVCGWRLSLSGSWRVHNPLIDTSEAEEALSVRLLFWDLKLPFPALLFFVYPTTCPLLLEWLWLGVIEWLTCYC